MDQPGPTGFAKRKAEAAPAPATPGGFGSAWFINEASEYRLTLRGHGGEQVFFQHARDFWRIGLRLVFIPLLALFFIAGPLATATFFWGYAARADSAVTMIVIIAIAVLIPLITFIVVLFMPIRSLVSDWSLTLEGRADLADSAFAGAYQSLVRREVPAAISTRRIRSLVTSAAINDYVIVKHGRFAGYLGMMPYGQDLYMSWTLWRKQFILGMLWRLTLEISLGRDDLRRSINTEPARAMREAIQLSMQEGVQAAVDGTPVDLGVTFGYGLARVEDATPVRDWQMAPGQAAHG